MKKLAVSVALAACCIASAQAGSLSVTSDRAAFEAAFSGPFTVEDFGLTSRFPISTGVLNSATNLPSSGIAPGLIQPGVTYTTPVGNGNFFNIDAGGGFQGGFLDTVTGDRLLTITFDHPVAAFGFDTNALSPSLRVLVNFSDGTTQTYATPVSQMTFVGFTGIGARITSAVVGDLANNTFSFAVDNVTFSPAATVPEPAGTALMLAGLAVVGAALRRRA